MSVVFAFSASLNDVAPVSPMLLSVDLMGMEECFVDECHPYIVSFVLTTQMEFRECCICL